MAKRNWRLTPPNGRTLKIVTERVVYPELGQDTTVWRASTRKGRRNFNVGAKTEDNAIAKLIRTIG